MNNKKNGFTLIELIIVMALTVVVLGIIFQMFNIGNRIFSDVGIKSTLQTEGQTIEEKISNIGMQASSIERTPNSEGEIVDNINFTILDENKDGLNGNLEVKIEPKFKFELTQNENILSLTKNEINTEKNKTEGDKLKSKDKKSIDISKNNTTVLSENVKSMKLSQKGERSFELEIMLFKESGYNRGEKAIKYPVNIKFTLRNKEK